jgi:hypothetical protein
MMSNLRAKKISGELELGCLLEGARTWNLELGINYANDVELGTWNLESNDFVTEEQVHISRPNTQTTAYE